MNHHESAVSIEFEVSNKMILPVFVPMKLWGPVAVEKKGEEKELGTFGEKMVCERHSARIVAN